MIEYSDRIRTLYYIVKIYIIKNKYNKNIYNKK